MNGQTMTHSQTVYGTIVQNLPATSTSTRTCNWSLDLWLEGSEEPVVLAEGTDASVLSVKALLLSTAETLGYVPAARPGGYEHEMEVFFVTNVYACAKALRAHERAAVARADSYEHSARQIDAQAQIDTLKTMELEQALDAALEKAER